MQNARFLLSSFHDSLSLDTRVRSLACSFVCCWRYLNIAVKSKGKRLKKQIHEKWENEIAEHHACISDSSVLASFSIKSNTKKTQTHTYMQSSAQKRWSRTLLRRHNWNKFDMIWLCMIAFFLFCGSRSNNRNNNNNNCMLCIAIFHWFCYCYYYHQHTTITRACQNKNSYRFFLTFLEWNSSHRIIFCKKNFPCYPN